MSWILPYPPSPPNPWNVPNAPITRTVVLPPPILPAPQPFSQEEINVLRELAKELIDAAEEEDEQDELEYLADKYGYELTPKPADDDTPF